MVLQFRTNEDEEQNLPVILSTSDLHSSTLRVRPHGAEDDPPTLGFGGEPGVGWGVVAVKPNEAHIFYQQIIRFSFRLPDLLLIRRR